MKIHLVVMALSFITTSLRSQPALTAKENNRLSRLREFCRYVKETELSQLDQSLLFEKYLMLGTRLEASSPTNTPERQKMLRAMLEGLNEKLNQMDLEAFDAIPWNQFKQPEKLPRMVWEAEPVTHLLGQSLQTGDREQELAQGSKQVGNIMVVFEKAQPNLPLYFVLFDEQTDKILSWILINQGGLHYFLLP